MSINMEMEKQSMAFTYNEIKSSIKTNKDITQWDDHRAKVPFFPIISRVHAFNPYHCLWWPLSPD